MQQFQPRVFFGISINNILINHIDRLIKMKIFKNEFNLLDALIYTKTTDYPKLEKL
jgi:hypothetical protein